MQKARKYASTWSKLPFMKEVYLCNSVAIGSAHATSDIDLVLVTAKNRLFLARLLWMIVFWFKGQRGFFRPFKNNLCPSIWLDHDLALCESFSLANDPYLDLWKENLILLRKFKVNVRQSFLLDNLNRFLGRLMLYKIHRKFHNHVGVIANFRILKFHLSDVRVEFRNLFWADNR